MTMCRIIQTIKKHQRFLITSHTNLEGDALGSELAMAALLRRLGKKAIIVNEDMPSPEYACLPGIRSVSRRSDLKKTPVFDAVIVLDCSDPARTGRVCAMNSGNAPVINIDHHISNAYFGHVNWVNPKAAACSEMVYELFAYCKIKPSRRAAEWLYIGILTDTGSFRYSNTTAATHAAVAGIMALHKINVARTYRKIYEDIPLSDMQVLGRLLPTMKTGCNGTLAWFEVPRTAFMVRPKVSFDLSEHLLGFARAIKGVELVLVFKENIEKDNEVRINFRSQGNVNVNVLAASFGGGGHPTASGATVAGTLPDVRDKVLAKARTILARM